MLAALLSLGISLSARAMPPQKAEGAGAAPQPANAAVPEPKAHVTVDGKTITVPLFSEQADAVAAATAADDTITVGQLSRALATMHEAPQKDGAAPASKDFRPILDRLVNARLLLGEAREMGIADLPEVKDVLTNFEKVGAREMLQERVMKDVKPDAKEVEQSYREAVRELKVRSVLFPRQTDANTFHTAVKAGGDFAALAKKAVADKKAKGDGEAQFVRVNNMAPQVAVKLMKLKPGQLADPIKLPEGIAIARLEDIRYPEGDAAARAEAEKQSLLKQKKLALQKYYDGLVKRYATIDKALLKKLDFQAKKPGIDALEKDKRIVARIQGAEPITVGELTKNVKLQFFHGIERAVNEKKVNAQIYPTFDAILSDRIVPLEARRVGIVDSAEYKRRRAAQEDGAVFSLFVKRVIVPQVKLTEKDVRAYYDSHKKEFAYPVFFRLDGLAYENVKDAQAALDRLRAGTDLKWLKANTTGQLSEHKAKYKFGGVPIAATAMPDDLRKQLTAAKVGDVRLFTEGEQSYVVRVSEVTPESQKPFDEVKADLQEKLFFEKVNAAVADYTTKLRKVQPVKVYITKID